MPTDEKPGPAISAQVVDEDRHDSISVTTYGGSLEDVARHVADACRQRWLTTDINDRRHDRRV